MPEKFFERPETTPPPTATSASAIHSRLRCAHVLWSTCGGQHAQGLHTTYGSSDELGSPTSVKPPVCTGLWLRATTRPASTSHAKQGCFIVHTMHVTACMARPGWAVRTPLGQHTPAIPHHHTMLQEAAAHTQRPGSYMIQHTRDTGTHCAATHTHTLNKQKKAQSNTRP